MSKNLAYRAVKDIVGNRSVTPNILSNPRLDILILSDYAVHKGNTLAASTDNHFYAISIAVLKRPIL
ncbi:MAG: hypothetical protein AMJ75_10945 [Phycisphaerae bacterium SM1_79]|nr:MAG: hypothetical protein AMJ75_10945 [Phycisphaerae bacterium SM1_79]